MATVHGTCTPEFELVRDAFTSHFDQGLEDGASVCVTLEGQVVVDLWGGTDGSGDAWQSDTLVNVWSVTKTISATVMLMLADRGELDLESPVAHYWPEFGTHGKDEVLVRHVLAHTAGLPGWSVPIAPRDLADHERVTTALAAQEPWWQPGTRSGYHPLTQGFLEDAIVRRITGQSLGAFFDHEVAQPLGTDFHIGLPAADDARVARITAPAFGIGGDPAAAVDDPAEAELADRVTSSCPLIGDEPNERWWREAEIPAANGTGNARSIARVHAALACDGAVDGVHLLSPAMLDRVLEEQSSGIDAVMGYPLRYGVGFGLVSPEVPLSPNARSFWWAGWGGAMALVDRDARMTVSYAMNNMSSQTQDLRAVNLIFHAYAALETLT
ncbi:beta-lactamase family protein [Nocardioides sp. NBC_00163]|uniref:serine hydrolase domain-containing protein n=1 Tax=Nocardioides sp. NBC_00163 TaxID=2975999 RepID=UPI003247DBAA